MGVSGGPYIVRDSSLVLELDAADMNSYVSGSTTWKDVSGNVGSGSLVNGITFSSNNTGNLFFNSASLQYVDVYVPNLSTTATIEIWCNLQSQTNVMVFGWEKYDVWTGFSGNLGYNTANSDLYGIPSAIVSSLGCFNNWKQYVFEMRSDVAYTNNKIYVNAVSQTLSQIAGGETSGFRNFNSGNGRIGVWKTDLLYCMTMNCASFKIYNRSLSPAEVLQNYNAQKSRFGLK